MEEIGKGSNTSHRKVTDQINKLTTARQIPEKLIVKSRAKINTAEPPFVAHPERLRI